MILQTRLGSITRPSCRFAGDPLKPGGAAPTQSETEGHMLPPRPFKTGDFQIRPTSPKAGPYNPRSRIFAFTVTIHRTIARLSPENYFGRQTYFITICCDRRIPHLSSHATSERVLRLLLAAGQSFRLHAFCLMPDHVHILAEGCSDNADLREFIRLFKQRTAYEFRRACGQLLWEKSYYDHILRSSDVVEEVAAYIWWNPVRKRLCVSPDEFPFSGSQTIDWIRRSSRAPEWSAPWKKKN